MDGGSVWGDRVSTKSSVRAAQKKEAPGSIVVIPSDD